MTQTELAQIIRDAQARPWAALKYAKELLTPEVLAECAKAEPGYAQFFAEQAERARHYCPEMPEA